METYGIVVCENDQVQLKNLHGFVNRAVWSLEDSPDSKDKTCEVVLVTTSYQEVVNYLNNTYIDSGVYFLDIDLGKDDGQNGIDLAEFIKSKDLNAQIIFITAYENFAAMTYRRRIGAVDFITKTELDQKRLNEALFLAIKRIRELHTVREQTFSYKMGRKLINQNIRDILYIVTTEHSHKLKIVTLDSAGEFLGNIKKIDDENEFLEKISQSCLANPDNIVEIDLKLRTVKFKDGYIEVFPRRNSRKIEKLINKYNVKKR